ncbi:restriction endonuclease subunit S [Phocaeicola coprophilus]|uniref:restriction endonuclease subunit S n=1 Tax=Phocaeicola coprophilus TaxID=387090 RepID=UPI003AB2EC6C
MDTKKLRQKILDLAIRGKLVPQDPNDEPASVLLERIKAEKEHLIKEGKIKRSKKIAKTSDTPHYGNVPFEVPSSWVWTTLPELCTIPITDGTHKTPTYTDKEHGVPFISSKDVTSQRINWNNIKYITRELHEELHKRIAPQKNDILLAKNGTTGVAAIVEDTRVFDIYVTLAVIRPSQNICPQYLHQVINSNFCKEQFNSRLTGIGLPNLHLVDIKKTMIPLPPISEQKRIVTEIERWFVWIEQIRQSKTDLQDVIKQTKSKILDLAIHGKLVPQDPSDEPASELLKRINPKAEITCDNAHYTQLPKGWAMCKLSDLCKIENGFAFSSDDYKSQGIPLVRISNITHNTIDITDCAYIEGITDDKFKISKGDLLIAMSGATTGKMGVYPFDETAYLNQRVGNIKILNKFSLYPNYRNTYMQSKVDEILKIAYGGAQPNISASIIGNFDFPLPPYKEQIRIVETVQRIFDQLDVITESL